MSKHSYLIIIIFSLLGGCRKTEDVSYRDEELYNVLKAASNGKGVSYFLQPDSRDYASIPQDPKNPLNPYKVELGKLLFHETRLGGQPMMLQGMYTFSCASCHQAKAGFQSGLAQGIGEGGVGFGVSGEGRIPSSAYISDSIDTQPVRSLSVLNTAFQEVAVWSGQFGAIGVNANTQSSWTSETPKETNFLGYQGLETQAIAGQSVHRLKIDPVWIFSQPVYKTLFNGAFPEISENERITKITTGLAIAAYERTLFANQSPFQRWLKGDKSAMSADERDGAILFFSKAKCVSCHTGPALNSMNFYSIGASDMENGRNGCINISSSQVEHKGRGGFTGKAEDLYKFKVPQLYNLEDGHFLGHGSSFSSIEEIVNYKNNAIPQNKNVPQSQIAKEFQPLNLNKSEIDKIVKFIKYSLRDPNLSRYVPKSLPSGQCFPNNDIQSRTDMGWR